MFFVVPHAVLKAIVVNPLVLSQSGFRTKVTVTVLNLMQTIVKTPPLVPFFVTSSLVTSSSRQKLSLFVKTCVDAQSLAGHGGNFFHGGSPCHFSLPSFFAVKLANAQPLAGHCGNPLVPNKCPISVSYLPFSFFYFLSPLVTQLLPNYLQAIVENPLVPVDFVNVMGVEHIEDTEDMLERIGHLGTPRQMAAIDREVREGAWCGTSIENCGCLTLPKWQPALSSLT